MPESAWPARCHEIGDDRERLGIEPRGRERPGIRREQVVELRHGRAQPEVIDQTLEARSSIRQEQRPHERARLGADRRPQPPRGSGEPVRVGRERSREVERVLGEHADRCAKRDRGRWGLRRLCQRVGRPLPWACSTGCTRAQRLGEPAGSVDLPRRRHRLVREHRTAVDDHALAGEIRDQRARLAPMRRGRERDELVDGEPAIARTQELWKPAARGFAAQREPHIFTGNEPHRVAARDDGERPGEPRPPH